MHRTCEIRIHTRDPEPPMDVTNGKQNNDEDQSDDEHVADDEPGANGERTPPSPFRGRHWDLRWPTGSLHRAAF